MPYTSYDSSISSNNADVAAKLIAARQQSTNTSRLGEEADSDKVGTVTSRGTKIVEYGENGMDKDSFLQLLVAQMTNMDPTQDQDSTAYVTQMAQFASIEQMNNLNTTMDDFSVRDLVGKHVIIDEYDESGNQIEGTVMGIEKKGSKNMLAIMSSADGSLLDSIDATKVSAIIEDTKDNSGAISSLNTQFIAASALKGQRVVIVDADENGETEIIKGKVEGTYLDAASVKLKINKFDDDLNETDEIEIYSYLDLYKAGDLSDEDMDIKASDFDDYEI